MIIDARFCRKCGSIMQEVPSDNDRLYAAKFECPDRCGCGHFERIEHSTAQLESEFELFIESIMRTVDKNIPPKYTH